MKENETKKTYASPNVEVVEITLEKGYAASGISGRGISGSGTESMYEIESDWQR